MQIVRLTPDQAPEIRACFERVYGSSYANELFYDVAALTESLASGTLRSVGALDADNRILGHMGMQVGPDAQFAELGNTVVDPQARGGGLAWRLGDALTAWCLEAGHTAYLHYPTTDHHIMQRQSVKTGTETGLMLGYIPAETDGQVEGGRAALRGAATIVVNPLARCADADVFAPVRYVELLRDLAEEAGLARTFAPARENRPQGPSTVDTKLMSKRGLARTTISQAGDDVGEIVKTMPPAPCQQLDLLMDDPQIERACNEAVEQGFVFCGWLPGFAHTDVLRLQRLDQALCDPSPGVVNPRGQALAAMINRELNA